MFLLVLGRLFLLALPFLLGIFPRSLWSPLFPLHALALILLSRQGAALAHLDSFPVHDLVLWSDGSVPFSFDKDGSGVFANCSFCGTEATLSFSAGSVCSSFQLKPAPFCTLFAGLGSTNKFSISLLLSDCRSVLAALSSPPSFLLSQTLWQTWQELCSLSCCIRL